MNASLKFFRKISSAVILLFVYSLLQAQEGQVIDGIAAIVGNRIILRSDVEQLALFTAQQQRINPFTQKSRFQQILKKTLNDLIDQYIILEQAKAESIEVKDRDVERALNSQIESMIAQVGSEDKVEEIMGMSLSKIKRNYRENIRDRLIVENFQQKKFGNIQVSRREVEDFYRTYSDSLPYLNPSAEILHILIAVKPGTSSEQAARDTLRKILERLKSGEDFGELAKIYSQDPGSRNKGGELGFIRRGYLVKEFEEAAFKLQPGEISDIVKTDFGYHIIQCLDKRGDKINVRHILITPSVTPEDEQEAYKKINQIREDILKGKGSFESYAIKFSDDQDAKNTKGRLSIDLKENQLPEFSAVIDTIKPGEISKPFRTDYGYHIIKLLKKEPGGKVDLQKHWSIVENMARQQKKFRLYQDWINSIKQNYFIKIYM